MSVTWPKSLPAQVNTSSGEAGIPEVALVQMCA